MGEFQLKKILIFLIILGGVFTLWGFENNMKTCLEKELHALGCSLEIYPSDWNGENEIIEVKILLKNSNFRNFNVDEGVITVYHPVFQWKDSLKTQVVLKEAKTIQGYIQISEKSLNTYFQESSQRIGVKNPVIKLKDDCIELQGNAKWWIINSDFQVKGTFKIENRTQIHFIPGKMKLNNIKVPSFVIKQFIQKINPIFDTSRLPFSFEIENVTICNERLILRSLPMEQENE